LVVASVYFTLKREIEKVRSEISARTEEARKEMGEKIESVKLELADLKLRVASVERALQGFSETLIEFLAARGVVSEPERVALRGFLTAMLPPMRSKYYTEEVRRRLLELLEKDDVTVDDLRELDRLSELIYKECLETGREDLVKYYKLRAYIALLAGLLRSKAGQEGSEPS